MCGRIAVEDEQTFILERFNAQALFNFDWGEVPNRSDISPGRDIPVIQKPVPHTLNKKNSLNIVTWGWWFFTKGAKGNKVKRTVFNSRSDTILRELDNPRKTYQRGLSMERVIVPVNAFFEWPMVDGKKRKVRLGVKGQGIFGLGGFLVPCKLDNGSYVHTVTIITTEPTEQMAQFHDRMPLILRPEDEQGWIDCKEGGRAYLEEIFSKNAAELESNF